MAAYAREAQAMKNDIHDLGLMLDSRVRLIAIESWEELSVLEAIGTLAVKRGQTWYTWNQVDGLQRLGFGSAVDTTEDLTDPEQALDYIRLQREPALFVFCDLHPFMQSPRLIRQLKMLAMDVVDHAPTLLLISHELALPPELRRLSASISLSMPSDEQLTVIIREEAARWSEQNHGRRVRTDSKTLDKVVRNLRGVTHQEARRLARRLIVDDGAITQEDLPALNQAKFSLLDMQGMLSFEPDTAQFADVGGLGRLKRWLADRHSAFAQAKVPVDAPKGVLLAGVQGSGKSLAARAVAGLWELPLLRLDVGALFNKYIGESEKNLRNALAMADAMEPCVLWIDEIEKGLAQDSSDQGVSRRMLATLLTWMAERKSRVFLVATANDVTRLPPELIRKGRLDELFFVDLPDAPIREDIFRIHLANRGLSMERFDLPALADASDGFAGAEIEQAVVSAVYSAAAQQAEIDNSYVMRALSETSPLSVVMAERVQALRDWARDRAVPAD